MIWVHRKPAPPLSDLVELLWYCESEPLPHKRERLLPSGTTELVVNLREDSVRVYDRDDVSRARRMSGTVLCGPQSEFFVIDTVEQRQVAGVHF